ncbi:putative S-layer protein [Candidatus Pacearchaeota archaeon]|nr:putative S-layer protein [Candidatus Pacearchaeota archaeon]
MKNKILALFAFSVIAFAFLVAGVSAATMATWDFNATSTVATATSSDANLVASAITVGTGVAPGTFTFSANGITAAVTTDNWVETTLANAITDNDYYQVAITPNTGFNFVVNSISFAHLSSDVATPNMNFAVRSSENNFASDISTGTSSTTSATATISSLNLAVGATETLTLRIYGYGGDAAETFTINNLVLSGNLVPSEVISCVTSGDSNSQLTVDSLDLSVEEGYGEDEEWYPLDLVNIDTNVDYSGDSDFEMKNIEVKWGLFDRDTNKWVIDDEEKDFDLEGGNDQDVKLQFKLDEKIDKLATGDIVAYAIATGEDEEFNDVKTCEYVEARVSMKSENALILDNLQYPNTAVQCLEEVLVTADIWNIGDDKLENNYVLVNNKDLGLVNQKIEVGDISDFDNSELSFTFTVPKGLIEKTYTVTFSLYDEDDDIFEIADSEADFLVPLSVKGNCAISGTASVSANLESTSVVAGKEIVVTVSVKNTGDKTSEYVVSADGYSAWASSATISNGTFSLNAGESKDVSMTLQIKEGVSGEQKFNINVLSAGAVVTTQPVAITVQSGGFLDSLVGSSGSGNFLWIIGALNVLLVLAIIVIAVRFFSK